MEYTENLHLNLPEETDPLEIEKLNENFKAIDLAVGSDKQNIRCIAIISSTTWTVPAGARGNKFQVLCQGGGANGASGPSYGASGGGGGNGGQTKVADLTLTPGEEIVATVGGDTSFGDYITATKGSGAQKKGCEVDISESSLGFIEKALGMIAPPSSGAALPAGSRGGRGFNCEGGSSGNTQGNLSSSTSIGRGSGGGGGVDIGDGTYAGNGGGGTGSVNSNYLGGAGGFGGKGYGSGGGGGGSGGSNNSYPGTGGFGGDGAPGLILVAWEV